ncbi:hypothetical protein A7C82_23320 [Salmonella enterica subsp. enterica serovar Panama]|nr:hypothetical protein [Salmonella enterica subsp. enterica serovar Panama]
MYLTQIELLDHICREERGVPLECVPLGNLNGGEVIDILLPISEQFIPVISQIPGFPYQSRYEKEANKAIKDLVLRDANWKLETLPIEVWRVLLERYIQTILFCEEKSHLKSLMFIPDGMTDRAKLKFVVVFWWYAMKLPYKVDEESTRDTLSQFHRLTGKRC